MSGNKPPDLNESEDKWPTPTPTKPKRERRPMTVHTFAFIGTMSCVAWLVLLSTGTMPVPGGESEECWYHLGCNPVDHEMRNRWILGVAGVAMTVLTWTWYSYRYERLHSIQLG